MQRRQFLATTAASAAGGAAIGQPRATSQWLRENIAPLAEKITGQSMTATLREVEFVGVLEGTLEEAIAALEEIGYSYQPLGALKYHPKRSGTDDGSYARVDPERPRWQHHVHLFERDGVVEVWSHYEVRPSPFPITDESWRDVRERLDAHYYQRRIPVDADGAPETPQPGVQICGAVCPRLETLLDA